MKYLALLLVMTVCLSAHAGVWKATNTWDAANEQRYQDWVRSNWTKSVFDQSGPLQGIVVDCADAVYTMRLLYSYENSLPFAVKDPSSNRIISNDMGRFNSIGDSAKRFRAFAVYLYDVLGTLTLNEDSYPVAISRQTIHSGVFLKTDKASHHSWTVRDLDRAGVPFLLYASRPARTTLLDRHYYPTAGFLWGQQDANGNPIEANLQTPGDISSGAGFRMYRYPQDLLKAEWQVPGYSTEQYQINRIGWGRAIQRALQITAETPEEHAVRVLGESCKEATDRIDAVGGATRAMATKSSSYCFNSQEFDDYSTPSRDSRSVGVFQELARAYKSDGASLSAATREQIGAVIENRDPGSYCPIKISSGVRMTLGEVVTLALKGRWSSNPNDSLLARWGRESHPTSHAASCPVY